MTDEFNLLMPFVVCKSKGGPYDDESFVAGFQASHLDTKLMSAPDSLFWTVYTALVPQVDLIAMRHGYTAVYEPTEYSEWTQVALTRVSA